MCVLNDRLGQQINSIRTTCPLENLPALQSGHNGSKRAYKDLNYDAEVTMT